MTHSVAAIASAATTADTKRTHAAPSTGASFAQVQAAAVKTTEAKDSSSSTSADDKKGSATSAPKGERTQKVEGHNYVEIIAGPRNGMFINNTGSRRDGEAFLIVKRHGREFHVYGSGDDRKVYEVGRKRETTDTKDTKDTKGTADTTKTTDTSASSGTTGASTTATGSGTTTS